MTMPDLSGLPDDPDTLYADDPNDPLVKVHQQHHGTLHRAVKALIPLSQKGAVSGVAPLGADSKVPAANLPTSAVVSDATATVKGVVQLAGALGGTAAAPTVPGLSSKVNTSAVGAASGVAPLGADSKVPAVNLPAAVAAFPLGCAENPVTDAAAARPTGITAVWWRTATSPTNAVTGDWVFLPDAGSGTAPITGIYVQLWDETNGTGVAGWTAKTNAGSVVRSTDAAKTGGGSTGAGSLQWAAVAAGEAHVQMGTFSIPVSASTQYTYKATLYNGDTVARTFRLGQDQADGTAGNTYITSGLSAISASVLPGAKLELVYTFTTAAGAGGLRLFAFSTAAAVGATFNLSRANVVAG
ncbi:MAG: hypothetical protein M3524_09700 [Actinomycetota bacterium]|nr:hypothetical protein [Actinomycetota bacterium]